jgi:multicomponent Na+:H+ antiporter subunit E
MTSWASRVLSRGFLLHWLALFAFWWILSGIGKPFHLIVGALGSALVALFTAEMQFAERLRDGEGGIHFFALPWPRMAVYTAWLLKEIVLANWAVLKVVLDPALPAEPEMIVYRTRLQTSLGRTILANSITLTPGTITVDVEDDQFLVHALVGGEGAVGGIVAIEEHIAHALAGIEPPLETRA